MGNFFFEWHHFVGSLKYSSLLQKSPIIIGALSQKRPTFIKSLQNDVTSQMSHHSLRSMGWLQLVECLTIQVSFAEYGSLLQDSFAKDTYILKHPTNLSQPILDLDKRDLYSAKETWQFMEPMGCRRLRGALPCHVSFANEPYKRDLYSAKKTCILKEQYGVATSRRMLKNIGLICKRALQKRPIFCKRDPYF